MSIVAQVSGAAHGPLVYHLATVLVSFWQKQASSRNAYILILWCAKWLHIPLNKLVRTAVKQRNIKI